MSVEVGDGIGDTGRLVCLKPERLAGAHVAEAAGASAGVDALDIPNLEGYDEHRKVLAEEIEDLVGQPVTLRARIVAMDTKEQAWLKDGRLERKIIEELKCAAMCLRGIDADEG